MDPPDSLFIDGWLVDAKLHRIIRAGIERKLEPRCIELLMYLAERPGEVVLRRDIEDDVWQGRIVGYNVLNGSIAKLRRAFDDTRKPFRVIETIPKSGYRLIATVSGGTAGDEATAEAGGVFDAEAVALDGAQGPAPAPWNNRLLVSGFALAALSLLAIALVILFSPREQADEPVSPLDQGYPSLAILPFKNLSNDPAQSVYADGLTDDLISDLSRIEGLRVAPRHSSFLFQGKAQPPRAAAEALGVRFIVQGSLRRSLADIRINVQLIDTLRDNEIWNERFDERIENLFGLQDKIIVGILEQVNLEVGEPRHSPRRTTNLEAYDYFLRAEHRRLYGRGAVRDRKIFEYYKRAIELDPLFVAAHTGLAREALTNWHWDTNQAMPHAMSKRLVYDAAGRALELDPENPEALAILGLLQAISGDHDTGLASLRSALAFDPNNPQLHFDLALALSYAGSHAEALEFMDTAFARHSTPPSAYFAERAMIYFLLGRLEEARADAQRVLDIRDWPLITLSVHGALQDKQSTPMLVSKQLKFKPWDNQQYYRAYFSYYRRPADIDLIVDSATRAGLPRYPYGFDPEGRQPLATASIAELTRAGLWRGKSWGGAEFFQQFMGANNTVVRSEGALVSGDYYIDGDRLCVIYGAALRDQPNCGHIYPGMTADHYTWVTLIEVFEFSVGE